MYSLSSLLRSVAGVALLGSLTAFAGPRPMPAHAHAQGAVEQTAPAKLDASAILRRFDDSRRGSGKWMATSLIQTVEKGRPPALSEMTSYNADNGSRVVLLFDAPKTIAGRGDLMIDRNIFYYDPTVGSWERRTIRDRLVGGMNRSDFYSPSYSDLYTPTLEGTQQVNGVTCYKLLLKAKPGADVTYSMMRMWIDTRSFNVLQDESYSDSGKLLRTGTYLRWTTKVSPSGAKAVYPQEIRFSDLETGGVTTMVIKQVNQKQFDDDVFTKAWFEHNTR